MPIYEYSCQSCHRKFDQLVRRMNDESKAVCPECGSAKTSRLFSVFAVGSEPSGKSSGASDTPSCGRCGGAPGSCGMG